MADLPTHTLRVSGLSQTRETTFDLMPDADEREAVAAALGLRGLRKLRFEGAVSPVRKGDWDLEGHLGATVVQDCVVTLAPVTTRIEETVTRRYLADLPEPEAGEVEMPEDDTAEELPAAIDVAAVMIEALALALPAFPRAEGADLGEAVFAAPGVAPMTDVDAKPFAGLAGLRDQLSDKDEG